MDGFAAADFGRRIGEMFRTETGGGPVDLTLDEVVQRGTGGREGGSFSVYFSGPASQPLGQGTRELSTDGFAGPIFLVPIASRDGRMRYEAVFN